MSELSEAINEMRNMRESYDELSAAAEAYNTGKTELAQNITAKGVEASASESLPELAEKVAAIAQESYTIDGGEMYAKQLFGSLETPNYWNLYDILEQLLSDGRLISYGGILLAEYYRGYDSLALSGAGAGGAYVVSDKDENGQFKMYTEDTTHTWSTEFDGKGNRWVAYCFADEGHSFDITNTDTCPRSIHIGRHVGAINCLVNGRISEIVVTDGNKLDTFNGGAYTQAWGKKLVLRMENLPNPFLNGNFDAVYLDINGSLSPCAKNNRGVAESWIVKCKEIVHTSGSASLYVLNGNSSSTIVIQAEKISMGESNSSKSLVSITSSNTKLREIRIIGLEQFAGASGVILWCNGSLVPNLQKLYLGYKTNDKSRTVNINPFYAEDKYNFPIIELQQGWCKPIILSYYSGLSEGNIFTYILQKLKQDEPNCGSGVTITLGSTNLAKLTSEESQALLAELRGTYGYTFA